MHRRGIPWLIVIMVLTVACYAQEPMNSQEVEHRSYQLLLDKNWNELITYGHTALKHNIDYFYLRLRIGIAFYELRKYRQSIEHFRRALAFNADDPLTQEYYYYSLLYSGFFDEARQFTRQMGEALRQKLKVAPGTGLNMVYSELGPKISSRQDWYANAFYFQGGLNHSVDKRFSVSHVFTYYAQRLNSGPFSQYQYYAAAYVPLKDGWALSPAFHVVGQRLDSTIYTTSGPGRPPTARVLTFQSTTTVGSLAISKSFGSADVIYASTISNVEGFNQYVQQVTVNYFPWGSNKFYVGSIAYYHWNQFDGGHIALNPYASWRPSARWNVQLLYFTNQKRNIVERNGYFVNNSPSLTASRWTAVADLSINRHFSGYWLYALENKKLATGEGFSYSSVIMGLKYIF